MPRGGVAVRREPEYQASGKRGAFGEGAPTGSDPGVGSPPAALPGEGAVPDSRVTEGRVLIFRDTVCFFWRADGPSDEPASGDRVFKAQDDTIAMSDPSEPTLS